MSIPDLSAVVGHVSSEAAKRLVVLSGLKSSVSRDEVEKLAGNQKRIRQLHFPVLQGSGSSVVCATILYCGKRDALKAKSRLNSLKFQDSPLTAVMYGEKPSKQVNMKRGRLIVRNLSFKCEPENLSREFSRFGDVTEVSIPKRGDGKKKGFGIVQFKSAAEAAEAVKQMNGTIFLDRPVAVDWMLAKDTYIKAVEAEEESDHADDVEEDDSLQGEKDEIKQEDSDEMEVDDDDEGEDDDEDDLERDEEKSAEDDDDDDDESDRDSDDDDQYDEDYDSEEEEVDKKNKMPARKPDVDEGRTVFVRNLSYDTMDEDLEEFMTKFGGVAYCRIVVDPNTEHPKGTAFVKFKSKDSVEKCLQASQIVSDGADGLTLDGRKLIVSLAVSRDKIKEIASEKKTKEKVDQRNLHLIRESLIRPGTKGAEGLSKTDIAKRMKVETITRQKLKNPDVFVSTTRLCVRNIPATVSDTALKKVFLQYAGNAQARISECRIMRDLNRIGGSKLGKSRGYAFINFTNHSDALQALRSTNNNPEVFGEKKRLIVEFSLENRSALLAKERRADRILVKQNMFSSTNLVRLVPKTKLKVDTVPGPQTKTKGGLVLPSHSGPKIRHKSRAAPAKSPKTPKDAKHVEEPKQKKKKKTGRRRKNVEVRDDVDKLVAKYRQKIATSEIGSRWTF